MARWAKKKNAAKKAQQQQLHAVIEQERTAMQPPTTGSASFFSSTSLDPVGSLYDLKKTEAPLSAVINLVRGMENVHKLNQYWIRIQYYPDSDYSGQTPMKSTVALTVKRDFVHPDKSELS